MSKEQGRWAGTTGRAAALGAFVGLLGLSAEARAQDSESEAHPIPAPSLAPPSMTTTPPSVVIVVQPDAVPEPEPRSLPGAPAVGASDQVVKWYLADLRLDLETKRAAYRRARQEDDASEEVAEAELREAERTLRDESDRLMKQDAGLLAGGTTLVVLGSAAIITAAALGLTALSQGLDWYGSGADPALGPAALGCALGGVAGLGAGIPMLVLGVRGAPREASDALPSAPLGLAPPPVGASLRVAF